MRAQVKKFKETLNRLVQELMAQEYILESIEGNSSELQSNVNLI